MPNSRTPPKLDMEMTRAFPWHGKSARLPCGSRASIATPQANEELGKLEI